MPLFIVTLRLVAMLRLVVVRRVAVSAFVRSILSTLSFVTLLALPREREDVSGFEEGLSDVEDVDVEDFDVVDVDVVDVDVEGLLGV